MIRLGRPAQARESAFGSAAAGRLLVTTAIAVVALAVLAAPSVAADAGADARVPVVNDESSATPKRLARLERRVLRQLNNFRQSHGLKTLRASRQLARAAKAHGFAMARKGFFSHDSANGSSFDTRIRRFYRTVGFRQWAVGENLLWSSGTLDGRRAIGLWKDSRGHRRNMLSRQWREVGVAAVKTRRAPGVFGGRTVTIVVTDFGSRA